MALRFVSRFSTLIHEIRPFPWIQCSASQYCSLAEVERISAPRTSINNPALHNKDHIGLWYTLEPDTVKKLFGGGSFFGKYVELRDTFRETSLMVREPALTIIDYIKRSNLSMPPNKFLLYGKNGVGKTMSLVHITHFFAEDGWLLLHIPWVVNWRRNFREITPSSTIPGSFDHPVDATNFLQHFRTQNNELLKNLQLTTSEDYVWTRRETTEAGSPLSDLIEHGINRSRFSSDVVMALTKELKKHATEGRCKVAVVCDGINSFFCPTSRFKVDHVFVEPQRFVLYQAFMHLFDNTWKNGCIVGSIDMRANDGSRRESYLPRYLLRQAGWEALDPFVPVLVDDYDSREMRSIIDYYVDREWIQSVNGPLDDARKEITALTSQNPYMVMEFCRSL